MKDARGWRIASAIARNATVFLLVVFSVLVCAYLVLVSTILVGSSTSEPTTTVGWVREIAFSSGQIAEGASWAAIGLTVMATGAVVGARLRRPRWMWVGIACGALFAVTLLVVTVSGPVRLERLVERANAAVVNGPAVEPPSPRPSPPPTFTSTEVRAAIQKMAAVSQAAAVGPVTDATGVPVNLAEAVPVAAACQDSGSEVTVTLDFRSGENARSRERILAAWDAAGYAPDRTMQEDVRYSRTLPVASMSLRDSTTIDGLIHMDIVGQCSIP
jgi:hypothetical protein